jgi:predicted transposase YbfD/YdcC
MLELKGAIVTIDAMGCQRAIAAQIVAQDGDYVLGLKGNQSALQESVADFFQVALAHRGLGFRVCARQSLVS